MNELFDIRIRTNIEGVPFDMESDGMIHVVGNDPDLPKKLDDIGGSFIWGLDRSNIYNDYVIKAEQQPEDFKEEFGWNIICPIEDIASGTRLYITALYENNEDMDMAVSAVINEAETESRKFIEEGLLKVAIKDPEGFKKAVKEVLEDEDDSDDFVYFPNIGVGLYDYPDNDQSDSECSICYDHEAAIGRTASSAPLGNIGMGKVTARDRNTAFSNLPERLSEAFMKDNAAYAAIVDDTFASYSADEMRALLRELGKRYRNLYKNAYDTSLQGVTKYELIFHPWDIKYSKTIKKRSNYRYYLFLKDTKGNETPILFKHNPSYCIYVMYMVDRYHRKEEVTDLSIKTMGDKFKKVYQTLIYEEDKKIEDLFKGMISRTTKNGNLREGRYGEYIKDIHNTLESMMDEVHSIPFKVGFGRYLQVPPEKISLPQNLANIEIIDGSKSVIY